MRGQLEGIKAATAAADAFLNQGRFVEALNKAREVELLCPAYSKAIVYQVS